MYYVDELASKIERVSGCHKHDLELIDNVWQLIKKRKVNRQHRGTNIVNNSLNFTVSFRLENEDLPPLNKAEVFLMPSEIQIFMKALINHPCSFPTNFMQQLSKERGMYCITLAAYESPEDFTERLFAAIRILS